ncbi:MAG: trigger factor [Pikeienuella sp.]
MQVTETLAEGLKREFAVVVTADDMAVKMNAKLDDARSSVQLKGFRKGKAPTALLKKMYGKNLFGEVVQESVDEAVRGHFAESGATPAQQPAINITNEDFDEGDDLQFELKYECLPEIPEADLPAIKLERMVVEVTDAEVDDALAKLAENTPSFKSRRKGSKAKDGDQVTFDFVGSVDGEKFDGGSAEDYPLVLGSNQFIPGFEEQLVGAKAGEEKEVNVTFPAEYGAENLAGKDAVFACTIKDVAEPKAAEIDDEMAKKYGADDLAALKEQMKERLGSEFSDAARQVTKRKLLDALDEAVSFDLPEGLVTAEADQIAHQLFHDDNPDVEGHDHEKVEATEEHIALAKRRVGLGLLLADMGRRAEVEVNEEEVNRAIFQQAQQYPGQERAFFDYVRQNEQAMQQLRAPLFEDKVVDYALELADVTDKSVTKDELEAAIKELED